MAYGGSYTTFSPGLNTIVFEEYVNHDGALSLRTLTDPYLLLQMLTFFPPFQELHFAFRWRLATRTSST